MNNTILTDETVVYYAIKVHGKLTGPKYNSPRLAENSIEQLPPAQQSIAEVVVVNADGQELLLG